MNVDEALSSIAADPGALALGMQCTSCHVPMVTTPGKLALTYCPHCGCSPERGHMAGIACDCPPHPVEGAVCE